MLPGVGGPGLPQTVEIQQNGTVLGRVHILDFLSGITASVSGNKVTLTGTGGSAITSPAYSAATVVSLAAGTSSNLNSAFIANGKTGKLLKVTVSSSVACKWEIKSFDGAVETPVDILYTSGVQGKPTEFWDTPDPLFIELAGNGTSTCWRITVTNLDRSNAADAHATFYWDEV